MVETAQDTLAEILKMTESPEKEKKVKAAKRRLTEAVRKVDQIVSDDSPAVAAAPKSCCGWISLTIGLVIVVILFSLLGFNKQRIANFLGLQPETSIDKGAAEARTRSELARTVMGYAFGFILLMIVAVLGGGLVNALRTEVDEDRAKLYFDIAKYVLGVFLPVVAAWVGTVMAFYFGRENFQAASDSVTKIAEQMTSQKKLDSTPVSKIGKEYGTFVAYELPPNPDFTTITLDSVRDRFKKDGVTYQRLPILNHDRSPQFCLHLSKLNQFLVDQPAAVPPAVPPVLMLSALLAAEPWLKDESFSTVPETGNASHAQAAMARFAKCSDVFVTKDGATASPVLRWITNVDLMELSKV